MRNSLGNTKHKYTQTKLNACDYMRYLNNKNSKPLFSNVSISDINNTMLNCDERKNKNINSNIDALLIFILDKEVLEILEKENYTAIIFDYNFKDKYNLINCLPSNIKFIEFDNCSSFNIPIENYPLELEYLRLSPSYNQSLDYLPHSIKYLKLYSKCLYSLSNLPTSIEYLDIDIIRNMIGNKITAINYLPDNIKVLSLDGNGEINIEKLPRHLEVLHSLNPTGGLNINMKEFSEMKNLTEIFFDYKFNKSIDNNNVHWPDSIKYLSFGEEFNQPLHNLPKYLEQIEVGSYFNLEEHIILANVKFPITLKTFIYIDCGFPKQQETIRLLNEIQLLYPEILFIHK